jgi:ketosteroid isomerase-like protein
MRLRLSPVLVCAASLAVAIPSFAATPKDELRATFAKFVAAQNAHDLKALEPLLLDSPDVLWITRGVPVWGRDEVLKKFGVLYQGTWHLEPDPEAFRVVQIKGDMAHIFVPVVFTIGAPGQPARQALIYLNQTLVRNGGFWKIASILPVSVPTPRE